jgi:hypothetical protein
MVPLSMLAAPTMVLAACTNTAPGTYECGGTVTAPVSITGASLSITTTSGFSLNAVPSPAMSIVGAGTITYQDGFASLIQTSNAFGHALWVTNDTTGLNRNALTTISTDGQFVGGIYAIAFSDLDTSVYITSTGQIGGNSDTGITVTNNSTGSSALTDVNVAAITGAENGIEISTNTHRGSAVTRVSAKDIDVQGRGILIANSTGGAGDAYVEVYAEGELNTDSDRGISVINMSTDGWAVTDIVSTGLSSGGDGIAVFSNAGAGG